MAKFNVCVSANLTLHKTFKVVAEDPDEAKRKALEVAQEEDPTSAKGWEADDSPDFEAVLDGD